MASALPVTETIEGWRRVQNDVTFDGGTANGIGDYDGTSNPYTVFSVTGSVTMRVVALCTTTLVGASATIELGTAKSTAGIIAQTTGTDVDANEIWHDASPDSSVEAFTTAPENVVAQDVILTVATANVTAGVIKFVALWKPISKDANVTAG